MRKPLIVANWKMNKTIKESVDFVNDLKSSLGDITDRDVVICVPFTSIFPIKEETVKTSIALGAQNLFWEEKGAFTGEISPLMLVDAGCKYVIVGHSERRQFFGETDDTVNRKMHSAFKFGLIPIVCVGEMLAEREKNTTFEVIKRQVTNGLKGLEGKFSETLVIAYEPVWAIGTGKTATPQQAQEVHSYIRKLYSQIYGDRAGNSIRILYGGSIKPDNFPGLMKLDDIDGGLIGGASLDVESFRKLVFFDR